jgi:hypothetical protein
VQPAAFCFFTEHFEPDSDSARAHELLSVMPVSHTTMLVSHTRECAKARGPLSRAQS